MLTLQTTTKSSVVSSSNALAFDALESDIDAADLEIWTREFHLTTL